MLKMRMMVVVWMMMKDGVKMGGVHNENCGDRSGGGWIRGGIRSFIESVVTALVMIVVEKVVIVGGLVMASVGGLVMVRVGGLVMVRVCLMSIILVGTIRVGSCVCVCDTH